MKPPFVNLFSNFIIFMAFVQIVYEVNYLSKKLLMIFRDVGEIEKLTLFLIGRLQTVIILKKSQNQRSFNSL